MFAKPAFEPGNDNEMFYSSLDAIDQYFGIMTDPTVGGGGQLKVRIHEYTYYPDEKVFKDENGKVADIDTYLNEIAGQGFKVASNGGDPERELVATGVVTSIVLFAGGGVGLEAGTIKYKGEEYGVVSFAVGGGLDISGGWNFLKIYADPNNFDIYDLEGAGGQGNASFTIVGGSWEAPFSGEQFTDQYKIKSWGWEAGPPIFWGGGSWTHTTTKIIPPGKDPTLYDLYKSRPDGY